jgi:hypothetical protein
MLIWPSDRDFYATYSPNYVTNGWEQFQKLKAIYSVLGRPEDVKWADTPLPHSLAYDSRLLIYNWFSRWLKHDSAPVRDEPPVSPEPVSALLATESGSVVRSLRSKTPFLLNKERKVNRTPASLESLTGAERPAAGLSSKTLAKVRSGKVIVEALEVNSATGVWLPIWLLTPDDAPKDKPVLLVLDPLEAERLWFQPDADAVLAPGDPVICAADVRGVGALVPEYSPGAHGYAAWHEQEENYAWGSLILGKPLVGQRVTDILALVSALKRPVRIAASGKMTIPALFAAALDRNIESLYLAGGLLSFQDIVDTEDYKHPFANFVPEFLNHTDLPELTAALAPRRVVIAGPVNARDATLGQETAAQIYAGANITLEPQADWSAARLIAFARA